MEHNPGLPFGLYMVGPLPPHTRLILAHESFLDDFAARTDDGRKVTAEWGEQSHEGWYAPIFHAEYDNMRLIDRAYAEGLEDAIKTTLQHPSIRAKIRRRLAKALDGVYIP